MRYLWISMLGKYELKVHIDKVVLKSSNFKIILVDTENCIRSCNHCRSDNWNYLRYLWLYTLKEKRINNPHFPNYVKQVHLPNVSSKHGILPDIGQFISVQEIKIACHICYFTSKIKNEFGVHMYQMHAKQKLKTSKVTHIPETTMWVTIVLCSSIFSAEELS